MTRTTKSEILLLTVVVSIATILYAPKEPYPPAPTDIISVPDSFYRGIILVDFTVKEEVGIRDAMAPLFTPQCTEAFVEAGLRSPVEVAMHEGVIIMPSSALYYYSARSLGFVNRRTRVAYQHEFSSGRAQAGTVSYVLNGVQRTTDGRARVFLHVTAFLGESFIFRRLPLNGVLAHEFIHVGGQPPTPGWFFEDDLGGFEHYDKIMKACACRGN